MITFDRLVYRFVSLGTYLVPIKMKCSDRCVGLQHFSQGFCTLIVYEVATKINYGDFSFGIGLDCLGKALGSCIVDPATTKC